MSQLEGKNMQTALKHTYPEVLWAGTEHALELAMQAHHAIMAGVLTRASADDEEDDVPYTFSADGDIGVVSIKGSLTNNDSPYNRYYGITSYAEIRRAMIYAASKPEIKAIVLDINSGGGAVSGVADTGNLISQINKLTKPVYAFSDGAMASAAYWLGVAAGEVHASNTALLGSIGVITTHMEYSKAYKEAGIGVTVLRAGEYKALANSVEPLTKVAEKQIQDQLNAAYGVFIGHVAERLHMTVPTADEKVGQGREFFGQAAVDAGLAKSIESYDSLISKIRTKILDREARSSNNLSYSHKGNDMTRKAMTEQQLAALAAGGQVEAAAVEAAAAAAAVAAAEAAATEAAAAAVATEAAAATAAATKPPASASVETYLQGQLASVQAQVLDAQVKLAGATERLTGLEALQAPLMKIAAASVSNMKVALGLSAIDLSTMTAAALLAEHAATEATFKASFKVGGVAAVSTDAAAGKTDFDAQEHMARVAATTNLKGA